MAQSAESQNQAENLEAAKLVSPNDVTVDAGLESLQNDIDLNIAEDATKKIENMGLNFEKQTNGTILLETIFGKGLINFDTNTKSIKVSTCKQKNENSGDIIIDLVNNDGTTESDIIKENETNLSIHKLEKDKYGNLVTGEKMKTFENDQYLMNKKLDYLLRISSKKDQTINGYTIARHISQNPETDPYAYGQTIKISKGNMEYMVNRQLHPSIMTDVSVYQNDKRLNNNEALKILNLSF